MPGFEFTSSTYVVDFNGGQEEGSPASKEGA
jgi:hypothetical protein